MHWASAAAAAAAAAIVCMAVSLLMYFAVQLFWSKRLKPSAVQSIDNRVFRKVLPGNRHTFQMQDLESDTTYIVQVSKQTNTAHVDANDHVRDILP